MTAYYNELDPYAAQWLRNLIAAGLIAKGEVDERDIRDIRPSELRGYTQCHFFAGLGGWSYALRLAGWPDDKPVWTGSCPCQPFSAAGKRTGFDDERHLWPYWLHLIGVCEPAIIFGEQVANKSAEPWLDLVQDDLEALGYAFGAVPLPAASVGAPHIRDRLWFVALADTASQRERADESRRDRGAREFVARAEPRRHGGDDGEVGEMADTDGGHPSAEGLQRSGQHGQLAQDGVVGELGDAETNGRERRPLRTNGETQDGAKNAGFWHAADWLPCRDGKARPVEPGTFPLAHGVPARVGRLRAYGNAIVPQAAAEFIRATGLI